MKIEWTKEAKNTLFEVTEYIREANPEIARKVVSHIHQSVSRLSRNPFLAPISLKYHGYRELKIYRYPFVVWYEIFKKKNTIEITLVWHTAQNRNI